MKAENVNIFSLRDIFEALIRFEDSNENSAFDHALEFASELTGMSEDTIYTLIYDDKK